MQEITLFGTFVAGLLSFLSPCILSLVPFYMGYLIGERAHDLHHGIVLNSQLRSRLLLSSMCFAAGIITVFVALGASATLIGRTIGDYADILRYLGAALITLMGIHFLGLKRFVLLDQQFSFAAKARPQAGYLGNYSLGLAFAFGWTPCVGPILAAILFLAADQTTAFHGVRLLFIYGLGMTLPFVVLSLSVNHMSTVLKRMRGYLSLIEKLTGILLILFGLLIASNYIDAIAYKMLELMPSFAKIG